MTGCGGGTIYSGRLRESLCFYQLDSNLDNQE